MWSTAVLWSAFLPLSAATVAQLDGQQVQGDNLQFQAKTQRLTMRTTTGETALSIADCDWIELGDGSGITFSNSTNSTNATNPAKRAGLFLLDGSWLPINEIKASDKDHTLLVTGPLGMLTIPLTAVRGWGVGAELLSGVPGNNDNNEDQVQVESGLISGRIEGLVNGKLLLKSSLDPTKPLELALEQIRGVRLTTPLKPLKGLRFSVALDDIHPPLKIVLSERGLALAAVPSVIIHDALLPARLRVEGGRRVYLSELDPVKREETGAFGVVWPMQKGRNFDGSPLRLGGVRSDNGLVVHSKATITWDLRQAYSQFRTRVGIADIVADQGDCAVQFILDDKVVWSRDSVRGNSGPQIIDLDVTNAKKLELKVDYGARYDIADHFVLADAYFITKK
jgi:NPCBM/NEW2 domain